MKHHFENHDLVTERASQFIDVTDDVHAAVERAEVENGMALVYSPHTTCAIVINELESGFIDDFAELLAELAPAEGRYYRHDDLDIRTRGDRGGHWRLPERALAPAGGPALVLVADDPDRRRQADARPLAARVLLRARPVSPAKDLHPGHRRMTATTGRLAEAGGRLPDEAAVLPLAAHENFSRRARCCSAARRATTCSRSTASRALVDQLGDEVDGDRLALLDRLEDELDRVFDGEPEHPLLRRLAPHGARLRDLPREPFLRLIEANRRDQEQSRTRPSTSSLDYCDALGEPGRRARAARLRRGDARADRAVGPRLHGAPARRALAGRRRGLRARPRLPAGRGPRALRRRAPTSSRRRHAGAGAARAARVRGRARARAARRGRAARRARSAAVRASRSPGYVGGGRANARRDRGGRLRRARRAAEGGAAPRACARRSRRYARAGERRPRRRRTSTAGASRASRARASTPACGCSRPTGATRSSPSTRSPGGSTTSPTATSRRTAKLARLERDPRRARQRIERERRPGARRRRRRGAPLSRSRSTRSATSSTAPRWTCAGTEYATFAELERYCRLRRRLDRPARARRLRVLRPRARPTALADDLGVALQLGEHPARPARGRPGRPRLPPARGPRALRLRASRRRDSRARSSSLVAFEAQRGARLARARPRPRAAARPPQRRLRPRDGRRVPPPARAHRGRPGARPRGRACRCGAGRRAGARAQPRAGAAA